MKNKSYLKTLKPKSELLKKVVAYYYFHVCEEENHSESFYFYPNYLHAVTIYIGNKITLNYEPIESKIEKGENPKSITCLYTVNSKHKTLVNINGSFHKIGIVFYPLGFNHFIKKPLNELMTKDFMKIDLGESINEALKNIDKTDDLNFQLETLENELLKLYLPFQEPILNDSIREIILSNGAIRISELEEQFQTNRKKLLRLFKKHTLISIEDYKKMVMFRNSLNYALQNKEEANLTDIALFAMYYDQSHFIKHFKTITKETPKTLLPKINKLGNEDLYWHFFEK